VDSLLYREDGRWVYLLGAGANASETLGAGAREGTGASACAADP
jgi:hypothetical protein